MYAENLFDGMVFPFGGLSNQKDLLLCCPEEFREQNPWSDYANKLYLCYGDISNWKWKSDDEDVRRNQDDHFFGILGTVAMKAEHKNAIAGWMLSEMLDEIPEYLPERKTWY